MRYILFTVLLCVVTACGFSPVYGPSSVSDGLADIEVAVIPNRSGQVVRNHLIDSLYHDGYPSYPKYELKVAPITEKIVKIGIDKDDEASRAQLRLNTSLELKDIETGEVVLKRSVRATSGYNILSGQFTTFVTQEDARAQALKAISNDILTQLELYLAR